MNINNTIKKLELEALLDESKFRIKEYIVKINDENKKLLLIGEIHFYNTTQGKLVREIYEKSGYSNFCSEGINFDDPEDDNSYKTHEVLEKVCFGLASPLIGTMKLTSRSKRMWVYEEYFEEDAIHGLEKMNRVSVTQLIIGLIFILSLYALIVYIILQMMYIDSNSPMSPSQSRLLTVIAVIMGILTHKLFNKPVTRWVNKIFYREEVTVSKREGKMTTRIKQLLHTNNIDSLIVQFGKGHFDSLIKSLESSNLELTEIV